MPKCKSFYTYVYLDPRQKGIFEYNNKKHSFNYEPFYIGKGRDKRYLEHLNEAKNSDHSSHKLNKIRNIIEDGYDPIIVKIIDNVSEKDAVKEEKRPIWIIGRADLNLGPLTNKTWGGDGGDTLSNHPDKEKIIKKVVQSRKGYKHSKETKGKIGAGNKGKSSSLKGRKFTEEEKERLYGHREYKNMARTGETNGSYGKPRSEKTKGKIRKANKGKIPWNKK